jgi:Zn-dependent protease
MLNLLFSSPFAFLFWILALVVAITVHEFSHALAADRLGDPTPRIQGRLTLNPLAHLDPLGTLMLFLVRFGWGKPVQFDPFNLQNPKRDSAIISLAGPASNLITASIASILMRLLSNFQFSIFNFQFLFQPLIILNVVLAVFNFLPIHPLDGFKIVGGLLSREKYNEWQQLAPYGIFILLIFLLPITSTGPLITSIIEPPINFLLNLLLP